MGFPSDQSGPKTNITTMLHMTQDMNNKMISFEHRLTIDPNLVVSPPFCLLTCPIATQYGETFACH